MTAPTATRQTILVVEDTDLIAEFVVAISKPPAMILPSRFRANKRLR